MHALQKRSVRLTGLILLLSTAAAGAQSSSRLTDFSWAPEPGGDWRVEDETLTGKDRPLTADVDAHDYVFRGEARCIERDGVAQIWLSFRYRDPWNRYAVALRGGLMDDLILYRYRESDGSSPDIHLGHFAPLGFDLKPGQWIPFEIRVVGPSITIRAGDVAEPQMVFEDTGGLTRGGIAVGGSWHRCEFRDLSIEPVEPRTAGRFSDEAIRINFVTPTNPAASGDLVSDGSAFNEAAGLGWNRDVRRYTRARKDREDVPAEQLSGVCVAHGLDRATFRYRLENGRYWVTPVLGDVEYPSRAEVRIDEQRVLEQELARNEFLRRGFPVEVTNGELALTFVSNHPDGQQGLFLSELIIEPWKDVGEDKLASKEEKAAAERRRLKQQQEKRLRRRQGYRARSMDADTLTLDGDWLFLPGRETGEADRPQAPAEADEDWHVVDVPAFLNPISFWCLTGNRGQAYGFRHHEMRRVEDLTFDVRDLQSGWYRQWFELPEGGSGDGLIAEFDAAAMNAAVYCNGEPVTRHSGMFGRFEADLTPFVQWGRTNLLAVYVSSNTRQFSREVDTVAVSVEVTEDMLKSLPRGFYHPAYDGMGRRVTDRPIGLWQPVRLKRVSRRVRLEDLFFKPRTDGADLQLDLRNTGRSRESLQIEAEVAGRTFTRSTEVEPDQTRRVTLSLDPDGIEPWFPHDPNLYTLKTTVRALRDGSVLAQDTREVGFRTIEVEGTQIHMNGRPYWLGGANMGPLAYRPNDAALARRFLKHMHEANQRIMRSHGFPPTETWARAADRYGVGLSSEGVWPWLMIRNSEIPDRALLDQHKRETIEIIKRLRNHPGILVWTVGNEQYFMDDRDPERKKKKWAYFQELLDLYRTYDGTRPVILTSGYVAHPGQAEYVEAHGFDDGDLADPHLYSGWYTPSVFSDQYAEGRYLPATRKPILSQEASTGYPNDDTGTSELHYIKLFVPQIWVGDDAFPDRNPDRFLRHQAVVTKEWIEDVRRTRRTAGWMMFSNFNWFRNAWSAEHLAPYPVQEYTRSAYADVLISARFRNRHVYAGNGIRGELVVVNDSNRFRDLSRLTCTMELRDAGGRRLGRRRFELPDCPYFRKSTAEFSFPIARDRETDRGPCRLELSLRSGDRIVARNHYRILVGPKRIDRPFEGQRRELVVLQNSPLNEYLNRRGIRFRTGMKSTAHHQGPRLDPQKDVMLISGPPAPRHDTNRGRILDYFVRTGGRLVLLETGDAADLFPDDGILKYIPRNVEQANIEETEHPLYKGLRHGDLKWWNSEWSGPKVALGTYELEWDAPNLVPLAEDIRTHAYGWKGPKTYPCFLYRSGEGEALVCELRASAWKTDPLAERLLSNLLDWALK
ncbi:glycoside hydrolase family 2 protein [Kiritimatiella glycovorans]|uniref:Beta-galactosidase n=1 Tax=Kiritimatiella glycovorans TaxID=1307763 RepID=A0A0G3ELX1_9BACT|nr:glycoside hydrolase family 2 [Kiritimatiella glycovorans]AKJ65159.1 Beta-galactosidase [Kiritimatiella glycovorans]